MHHAKGQQVLSRLNLLSKSREKSINDVNPQEAAESCEKQILDKVDMTVLGRCLWKLSTYAYLSAMLSLIIAEASQCESKTLQLNNDAASWSAGSRKLWLLGTRDGCTQDGKSSVELCSQVGTTVGTSSSPLLTLILVDKGFDVVITTGWSVRWDSVTFTGLVNPLHWSGV